MNFLSVLCRRSAWCILLISSLVVIRIAYGGDASGERKDEPAVNDKDGDRERTRVRKLIDDLVNRNAPPKLVVRSSTRFALPLFPETYDWKEEERINQTIKTLQQHLSVELCEELIASEDDKRYCVTITNNGDFPELRSVGSICGRLAYRRLLGVFKQHLPRKPSGRTFYPDSGIKDLTQWRKQRKDRSIAELQIELGGTYLRELLTQKDIPDKDILLAARNIAAEMAKIEQNKKPTFLGNEDIFGPDQIFRSPAIAQRVREVIRSGSTESVPLSR